jgi:hypothetical protein
MSKKEEVQTKEEAAITDAEARKLEEQLLLAWLSTQLLATEIFEAAESTLAKQASITFTNKMEMSINSAQKKEAAKFMKRIQRDAIDYKQSSRAITGYIAHSPRIQKVIQYAIDKSATSIGDILKEALEKFPKENK